MLRLDGKTAFITGCGASGPAEGDDVLLANGQAIALTLAAEGARIFGIDRNPEALARTAAQVRDAGGTMQTLVADVTDPAAVVEAVASCVAAFGAPNILVNNVGESEPGDPGSAVRSLCMDLEWILSRSTTICTCVFLSLSISRDISVSLDQLLSCGSVSLDQLRSTICISCVSVSLSLHQLRSI